jgi:hypothetical protein
MLYNNRMLQELQFSRKNWATFAVSGNLFSSAYACETNAKGCIAQGGPGQSGLSPPEVSGCHAFPPVAPCAQMSTSPLGLKP